VSATLTLTVNALPTAATVTSNSPVCSGEDAIFTISGTATDVVTYNIDSGADQTVTIEASGTVDVTVSSVTTNTTINLTKVSDGTCERPLNATATVVVNPLPEFVDLDIDCTGANLNSVTVNATISSGTLEYRVDGGAYQLSNVFTGLSTGDHTFDIRETTTLCDVSTGLQSINSNCPTVSDNTIAASQTICETSIPAGLTGSVPTITPVTSFTYQWQSSPAGSGTWTDQVTTQDYSPGALSVSTDYRRLIKISGCPDDISNIITITINSLPVANAGGDATLCEYICIPPFSNGEYELFDATVANACGQSWISLGDGTFDNSDALHPVYTLGTQDKLNGTVELCLTAEPCSPCTISDTDCMTLSVQPFPDADAGSDISICSNESAQLDGTSQNSSGVFWDYANIGEGDGVFSSQIIEDPTYTPGPDDILRGYVDLAFVVFPVSPCTFPSADMMTVYMFDPPEVDAGADATINYGQSHDVAATIIGSYATVEWTSSGSGTFDNAGSPSTTYYQGMGDVGQEVTLTITVTPFGVCSPVSDDLFLTINPTPIIANDDNGTPVNGFEGGVSYNNVLDNDLLNGNPVIPADISLSEISSTNPNVTLDPVTGEVIVAAGTPAGIYYLMYEICEIAFPTNCDQATVTVPVTAAPIIANDDSGAPVNGYEGGTSENNVLNNDLLNGDPVLLAEVTLTEISSTDTNVTLDPATGEVNVAPGTPAGTYFLVYEICEILNPGNCDQATVTIPVTAAPIVANDDDASGTPVNGYPGGTAINNILDNDLLNGDPVIPAEVTITAVSDPVDGVTLNITTGAVTVDPQTPAGTYYITYEICEVLNPTNCDQAIVTVVVTAAPIVANDDPGTPVNGIIGGVSVNNVLDNDLLNGDPVIAAEVILSEISSTSANVTLDPNTGEVIVAPGTPVGTYYLVYQICEILNPANCDQATVTVPVWEEPSGLFCFNGETAVSGSSFTYCSTETIIVTLCDILTGVAPFDICWEVNGVPGCATGVNLGDPLFSEMLPLGIYNIQFTSITDAEGHSASDVSMYYATVNVVDGPDIDAGENAAICIGDSYTLADATAENFSSLLWTGGDGTFNPSNDILNPTYMPGSQDIADGTFTLYLTAQPESPCTTASTDSIILTIQAQPEAAAGNDIEVCQDAQFVQINGTVTNAASAAWSGGDGFFDNPASETTTYYFSPNDILAGTVELCLTAQASSPCTTGDTDCLILTITSTPDAFAGNNNTICEGESFELTEATATSASSVSWSGGDGIFLPGNAVINPTYEPGPTDITNGTVVLCLTAQPEGTCPDADIDCMTLTISQAPDVEPGLDVELDCTDYDVANGEWLPVEVNSTITGDFSSIEWTSDGDGYFVDPHVQNAVYILGIGDIWKGDIELCIEVQGAGACQFTATDCIMLYVPQQLIYFDKDTWWGVSSYLDPDQTSVPEVMDPLVLIPGSQHLITMVDREGRYFWPEPVPPSNTIGDWGPVGYKVKTKNTPACLPIYGDSLTDQTFLIDGNFIYLPVLTNVPVDINNLFGPHVNDILLIYDWPVGELWTPVASDFDVLLPGRAYLLVNKIGSDDYTIEFPDFDPYAPHLYPPAKDIVMNNSPWRDVENTSQPHIFMFTDEATMELEPGDIIGAFNASDECFGMAEYEGRDSFYKLVAMGDNSYSAHIDGFETGEQMMFRLYRQNTGETFEISFDYDNQFPNYDGLFAVNGASSVVGLSMNITSIGEINSEDYVNIYPNPVRNILNITSEREIRSVSMVNHLGQFIFTGQVEGNTFQLNISAQANGVYFLRIETSDGNLITKCVFKE
jgi:hypothetical protein